MIGDLPADAPRECRRGRHIGQENGGTMAYTCTRCGGCYWQEEDYRGLTALADRMIDRGEGETAVAMAHDVVRRTAAPRSRRPRRIAGVWRRWRLR